MNNEKRTSTGAITRVHVDRRERDAGYIMRSHHCHPYFELSYIEYGSCRFLIEDSIYELHDGDFLLIPPQLLHYTRYLTGPCRRCGIYFRLNDLSEPLREPSAPEARLLSRLLVLHTPEEARPRINALLARMAEEEENFDERSPLMLHFQLQELLLLCGRVCVFARGTDEDAIHSADQQILLAARFINEHFRQQISAADIAAAAGFSPNYLSRKFREAAGIGVHEYLMFIRLRCAAFELRTTDCTVTQVALRCGFSDSNYFKDAFKKKYGVTPREYRKTR